MLADHAMRLVGQHHLIAGAEAFSEAGHGMEKIDAISFDIIKT